MQSRVFSFSVKPGNKEAIKLVNDVKMISIARGVNFSHILVEALKLYKEQVMDPSIEVNDGR